MGFEFIVPRRYSREKPFYIILILKDIDGMMTQLPIDGELLVNTKIDIYDERGNLVRTLNNNDIIYDTPPGFDISPGYAVYYEIDTSLMSGVYTLYCSVSYTQIVDGYTLFDNKSPVETLNFQIINIKGVDANKILVTQDWGDPSDPNNYAGGWVNIDGRSALRDVRVMAVNDMGIIVDETYTDENGNWSLALRRGKYTIKFRKYGFTFEDKKVVVE